MTSFNSLKCKVDWGKWNAVSPAGEYLPPPAPHLELGVRLGSGLKQACNSDVQKLRPRNAAVQELGNDLQGTESWWSGAGSS